MNYLQLCNRLRLEAGCTGSDMVTVAGQTGENARIVQWIANAWQDIQSEHQDWQWLRTTAAFPTVAGQVKYTTTQANTSNFGMWARDTFRNYANPPCSMTIASPCVVTLAGHGLVSGDQVRFFTDGALPTGITTTTTYYVLSVLTADTFTIAATAGGTVITTTGSQSGIQTVSSSNTTTFCGMRSEIYMAYMDYDAWRNQYLFGAIRYTPTRPVDVTIGPDKSISTGPLAAAGYTVLGDYFTAPVDLSVDADTPAIPSQFHIGIVWRALQSYGLYEAAPEAITRGQDGYDLVMGRIENDRLPELIIAGALA